MSKSIAIFASHMPVGGVPRMIVNISEGLLNKGYEVELVLCKKDGEFLKFLDKRVNIIDLNSTFAPTIIYRLYKYLKAAKPSSIFATGLHRNIYACFADLLANSKSKLILSERIVISGYYSDRHPAWMIKAFKLGYKTLSRALFKRASIIHGVSQEVCDDLQQLTGLEKTKFKCVYNPFINESLISGKAKIPEDEWIINQETKVVLSVGRLHPQKDFVTLIKAFAKVHDKIPQARLIILGEGSQKQALTALAKELSISEYVKLPGFESNPYGYMAHADVFVLSSLCEGLANVLVEALACGAPVISTLCPGGIKEILSEQKYGLIVQMQNETQMADAILESLNNLDASNNRTKQFLSDRSHEFTKETSVKNYIEMLT